MVTNRRRYGDDARNWNLEPTRMGFSLFPKTTQFFDLFRDQHRRVYEAAEVLYSIFKDFSNVEEKCRRINVIESEGDQVYRTIARELSLTFITPIDREDIHEINVIQEGVLNRIKAVSVRMGVYDFESIRYPAKRLTRLLRRMIAAAGNVLEALARGEEAGEHIERIQTLKLECEMLLASGLGEIYDAVKSGGDVLEAVKWNHIFDRIEQAVEEAADLGEILEGLLLKHA